MSNFNAERLVIPEVILIRPRRFLDERGWFMETYKEPAFAELGVDAAFVQDNHSMSRQRGTVRALHCQRPPRAQAKLVRVTRGSIFDVAVDLRRASPTFGRHCGAVLTAAAGEQLFIPRGFAHGFCTLEDDTEVIYKVDDVFAPDCELGVRWDDTDIAIDWRAPTSDILVSRKDAMLPSFAEIVSPF